MQVFVCEYLSGGGLVDGDAAATAVLMPQGLAMRDALVADLLASGDCDVTAATCVRASALPAGAAEAVARDGESPVDFAARLAAEHDAAWIIAPETGGCLAEFERAIGAPRWLGCDARSIAIGSSKSATLSHLAAHGLPTPWQHEPLATRWVVKPDDGAGSVATRVHGGRQSAEADLAARHARGDSACLEPWVEGEALSLSLLCELGQAELLCVNRQRIATLPDGSLRYDGVSIDVWPRREPRRRTLAALASRVAAALPGLRGFVGIDLVWHAQHGPVLIEINPRLTCAYVGLSQRLGRNLAAEVLALQRLERIDA
ncbi:ATP-grasp domain-containing protein [Variovorax sp. YR752]|uniref:ATP-grasp domain-containing protein n=1 Tax=Variovorax sp. YR752 TaxID=1884383 RepID=UPI0031382646